MALIVGLPEKAHRHTVSPFICPGKAKNESYPEFLSRRSRAPDMVPCNNQGVFDPCRPMQFKEEAKELNFFGKVFFSTLRK